MLAVQKTTGIVSFEFFIKNFLKCWLPDWSLLNNIVIVFSRKLSKWHYKVLATLYPRTSERLKPFLETLVNISINLDFQIYYSWFKHEGLWCTNVEKRAIWVVPAQQLYWNHTFSWVYSCKFAAYFQGTFS